MVSSTPRGKRPVGDISPAAGQLSRASQLRPVGRAWRTSLVAIAEKSETEKGGRRGGRCALVVGAGRFGLVFFRPWLVGRVQGQRNLLRDAPESLPPNPSVDVGVPAYLEAGTIANKIRDLSADLAAHDGRTRVIVVASDTETAVAAASADRVLEIGRSGKAAACNAGAEASDADIVVFTDANCKILPNSWPREMVSLLGEWNLVSGQKGETGGMEHAFWAVEGMLKGVGRGAIGTLAVAGEFIATRRSDYRPIPPSVVLDDLAMAMDYASRGLSVMASPTIRTDEEAASGADQWVRRVRIAEGLHAEALPRIRELALRPEGRVFIAHKLYRVTLGCAGYWVFVLGLLRNRPSWSAVVVAHLGYGVLGYAGRLPMPKALQVFAAIPGLQAIPLASALRLFSKALRGNAGSGGALWKKVPR